MISPSIPPSSRMSAPSASFSPSRITVLWGGDRGIVAAEGRHRPVVTALEWRRLLGAGGRLGGRPMSRRFLSGAMIFVGLLVYLGGWMATLNGPRGQARDKAARATTSRS